MDPKILTCFFAASFAIVTALFKDALAIISDSLIEEMEMKYPDKDITQAKTSFLNYPYHQGKRCLGWQARRRFSDRGVHCLQPIQG